jgi:hypothetical protein
LRADAEQLLYSYHDPNLRIQVMNVKKNSLGEKIPTSGSHRPI